MSVGAQSHVKIGTHEYLVRPGSYIKRQAPQFGARFTTGDPDFNNLSFWQHWAQQCWVGGVDQDLFADDAMFDESVGIDSTEHEVMTIGRGLLKGTGSNWDISAGGGAAASGFRTCVYNNILYVATLAGSGSSGHLYRYDPSTDGWVRITSLDASAVRIYSITTFDGKLFIGGSGTGNNTGRLVYSSGALSSWTLVTNPSPIGTTSIVTSMRTFQQKLYVAYAYYIWRMKDDQTWDGNTHFYKANMNSESNGIWAMETHLGFLYMLSDNGHVHRTDGNATFDIWQWDGGTSGIAIKSFDGRLFILTHEYTSTADVGQGCLYQMSGSAVTQLKRWGDNVKATRIGSMMVFNRRLFYGGSNLLGFGASIGRQGFGVAVYDPIEDAHSLIATNTDTTNYPAGSSPFRNHMVDDIIQFQGKMFVFVRGYGAFYTPYAPPHDIRAGTARLDITQAGGSAIGLNGGWFTTSTYDGGTPGVLKLWRKVIVDCAIPTNTAIIPEYSIDNGASYTALAAITTGSTRHRVEYHINPAHSTSFKLRFTLRSTDIEDSPSLYGFVVSYVPVPEPNWLWTMTLVLSAKQQQMDNTIVDMNTEAEMLYLAGLHRAKELIPYQDVDGSLWATGGQAGVLIYDIEFRVMDMTQPLEGEVVITLLEAVETY